MGTTIVVGRSSWGDIVVGKEFMGTYIVVE